MSWLWRSDTSPASYEKALAKLSGQISAASVSLDKTRSRHRRAKALWTLYTSLTYLVATLILVLVIGPQDWSIPHYSSIVGGPLLIYGVRQAINAAFAWSAARQQANVEKLQAQREEKITELKKATRYDSTQELLQKYGGAPPKSKEEDGPKQPAKRKIKTPQPQQNVQRTGLPPPPTANIQPRVPPMTPPGATSAPPVRSPETHQTMTQSPTTVDEPGFAPNAFPQPSPPVTAFEQAPHWYDRILDVMLGEDEGLAKNRLVLLCQNCRLVNGQAPPGVTTLEELGRWRCQSCGAWNGVQAEAAKVVQEMTAGVPYTPPGPAGDGLKEDEQEQTADETRSIDEQEGATGTYQEDVDAGVTKRLTRSAGKPDVDGL